MMATVQNHFTCPRCGAPSTHSGVMGRRSIVDGRPVDEFLGYRYGHNGHEWEVSPAGELTVLPDPPPSPPPPPPVPVFDEWSRLNQIMCDGRSRFDVLREELPKCKTKAEVRRWIGIEGFGQRYPILPESLPD